MRNYVRRQPAPAAIHTALDSFPPLMRELLASRGATDNEAAQVFMVPSWERDVHDPLLLPNMERAVRRILSAIQANERVVIWSDYDHDGIPGGVLLYDFFRKINFDNFENYIPHRHREGFGLNIPGLESLAEKQAKIIITVDCGMGDFTSVTRATELGMDVIIADHHLPPAGEPLPPAYAIVNPKLPGCTYPSPNLCGAGVAFKLVQGLIQLGNFELTEGWEKWLLDMAGLSTIADMVPLSGENRALAYYGLTVLRKSPRPGLQKLCRTMALNQRGITEDDVGFSIAPRINAAGRMDDPRMAFDLLTAEESTAEPLARALNKLNDARKGLVGSMVKEMKGVLRTREEKPLIVMGNPTWRPGLLGLAANTLMEAHQRPVFLWGREGGETLKGSCRSDGSVDVVELMGAVREKVFVEFGGHRLSGGFAIALERVHVLEAVLLEAYERTRGQRTPAEIIEYDADLSIDEVTEETWRHIARLAPFGVGNPKPLFMFHNVEVTSSRNFGRAQEHVEVQLANSVGRTVKAISFFAAATQPLPAPGSLITLAATFEKSSFMGRTELRLRIADIISRGTLKV